MVKLQCGVCLNWCFFGGNTQFCEGFWGNQLLNECNQQLVYKRFFQWFDEKGWIYRHWWCPLPLSMERHHVRHQKAVIMLPICRESLIIIINHKTVNYSNVMSHPKGEFCRIIPAEKWQCWVGELVPPRYDTYHLCIHLMLWPWLTRSSSFLSFHLGCFFKHERESTRNIWNWSCN